MLMMKKILIAAAALFALAGAAQAQVAIYGLIDMCYGKSLFSDAVGLKEDFHSGGDNFSSECNSTTRVGVKGSADVGSGVKANFKFETAGITKEGSVGTPDPATGFSNQAFFRRAAWGGLSGSFGEFRFGRMNSVVFDTMVDYDLNGASNGVSSGGYTGVGIWATGRQDGILEYISPKMGGATVMLSYKPKGDGTSDNFAGSVKFDAGPLSVALVSESKRVAGGDTFTSVGGTYDFKVVKVMLGYADGGTFRKGLTAGITAPIAGFSVGAMYADNSQSAAAKPKAYELFINKEVFKNTYGYAEWGNLKDDATTNLSGFAVGLIYVF
jgi:predicted porin